MTAHMEGERQIPGPGTDTPARWSIAVDFDGVIHQHISPWIGDPCHIPDPPVTGAIAWLTAMVERYDVFVFTCRLLTPRRSSVERAMCRWLAAHGASEALIHALHFASEKPHAGVYIDDRAMRFEGSFPTVAAIDAGAVPWNKRPAPESSDVAAINDREDHIAAGEVSVEEARRLLSMFISSHFRHHAEGPHGRARFTIPADPARDSDIRLGAFISRAEKAFARLAYVEQQAAMAAEDIQALVLEKAALLKALGVDAIKVLR